MRGAGPRGRAALLSSVDSSLTSWDPDADAWGSLEIHSHDFPSSTTERLLRQLYFWFK